MYDTFSGVSRPLLSLIQKKLAINKTKLLMDCILHYFLIKSNSNYELFKTFCGNKFY